MTSTVFGPDYAQIDGNSPPRVLEAQEKGLAFAIVRAALGVFGDPTWQRDAPLYRAHGVPVGPYVALLYPRPGHAAPSPAIQARAAIEHIGELGAGDLHPWLDVEFGGGREVTGLSAQGAIDYTLVAHRILVEHYGVCGIYSSARVGLEDLAKLPCPELHGAPKWLAKPYPWDAHVPAVLDPKALLAPTATKYGIPPTFCSDAQDWEIQQYMGDAWNFPGGLHQVDVNRWHVCRIGEKGGRVARYQKWLGMAEGTPGAFDEVMRDFVAGRQRELGLVDDGAIGPFTYTRIWPRASRN